LGPAARQKWPSLLLEIALILLETAGHLLKVRVMPIGKIHKLVHLSQQTYQPNSKLVPGHNDKGYGTIDDGVGREVYFRHDAIPGIHGFDELYRGQTVE
jgi:hypothetical protein